MFRILKTKTFKTVQFYLYSTAHAVDFEHSAASSSSEMRTAMFHWFRSAFRIRTLPTKTTEWLNGRQSARHKTYSFSSPFHLTFNKQFLCLGMYIICVYISGVWLFFLLLFLFTKENKLLFVRAQTDCWDWISPSKFVK